MLNKLLTYFAPTFLISYSIYYLWQPCILNHLCSIAFLLMFSWTMAYYFYEKFNDDLIDDVHNKIVLITGCDTGFGNNLAFRLDKLGFNVFAGVLFPEGDGAKELKEKCSKRLRIVKMDVTKLDDVQDVVEQIKKTKIPLWAVVNNAGIGISMPFEFGNDVDEYKKLFEINVFGLIRVTKCCIPLIRKSRGRIINVASLAGRLTTAHLAHYSMAKHSVRVFSDTLRREIMEPGVHVITIEPTFFKTPIIDPERISNFLKSAMENTPKEYLDYYGDNFLAFCSASSRIKNRMFHSDISPVINSMVKAVMRKHPKLYYRCCSYLEVILLWAMSHSPEILFDAYLSFTSRRDKLLKKYKVGIYKD